MTKDEFLDIMGGIDENIIDSTLDISRMDTIVIPNKRLSLLKCLLYAAACVALVFAVSSAVRYFNGKVFLPNSGTSDSTSIINISESTSTISITDSSEDSYSSDYSHYLEYKDLFKPDFIRGWNPDDITADGELVLGGSAVVSQAELNGVTVSLILHDITKLPGEERSINGFDYTDYWGARDIVLYAKNRGGDKVIYDEVSWLYNDEEKFIHSKCLFNGGTRLLQRNKPSFVVQYVDYDEDKDAYIASFLDVNPQYARYEFGEKDENNISNYGIFRFIVDGTDRIGGVGYGYQASGRFYRKNSSVFVDAEYGYELHLNDATTAKLIYPDKMPEGYEDVELKHLRGWDPEKLEYNPYPGVGESAIVSTASVDDMTVSLVMIGVQQRPGEQHRIYSNNNRLDLWRADEICIYVKHSDGRRMIAYFPPSDFINASVTLPEKYLFDGCIRLFKTEKDGDTHYLMMRIYDKNEPVPSFYDLDIDFYTVYPKANEDLKYQAAKTDKDENGIRESLYYLQPVEISPDDTIGSGLFISESFEYKGGTTFADPVYGYELTFDFDNRTGTAVLK